MNDSLSSSFFSASFSSFRKSSSNIHIPALIVKNAAPAMRAFAARVLIAPTKAVVNLLPRFRLNSRLDIDSVSASRALQSVRVASSVLPCASAQLIHLKLSFVGMSLCLKLFDTSRISLASDTYAGFARSFCSSRYSLILL